jgi:hypothetical protein
MEPEQAVPVESVETPVDETNTASEGVTIPESGNGIDAAMQDAIDNG